MLKTISPKAIALTFGILVLTFLAGFYIFAWTEPGLGVIPPNDNVPSPLNTGSTAQTKTGALTVNGVLTTLSNMIVNLVTIKGDGSRSENLNADKVDDYHAADLITAAVSAALAAVPAHGLYGRCRVDSYNGPYSATCSLALAELPAQCEAYVPGKVAYGCYCNGDYTLVQIGGQEYFGENHISAAWYSCMKN